MLPVQLELFGGLPKPPAKIREDEPVLSANPETEKKLEEPSNKEMVVSASSTIAIPGPENLQDSKLKFEEAEKRATGIHILMPDTKPHQQVITIGLNKPDTTTGLSLVHTAPFEQKFEAASLETPDTTENMQEPTLSKVDSEAQVQAISEESAAYMQLEQVQVAEATPQVAESESTFEDIPLLYENKETEPDATPSAPEELNEKTIGEAQTNSIPDREALYKRQYYTMRETADMFGVNQSLLRYWENEFSQLKPRKNRKGDRYFRPQDIESLKLIFHLLKVRKFTIEGAKEYLKQNKRAFDTFELVQKLEKLKTFLQEIRTNL